MIIVGLLRKLAIDALYRSMTQNGQRTLLAIAETLSGIFGTDGAEA